MRKIFIFVLMLFALVACTTNDESPLRWSWVYPHGESIQLPAEWQFVARAFVILDLADNEGVFRIAVGKYPNEEASTQQNADYEKSLLGDNIRFLRREFLTEQMVEGINDQIELIAIYPSLHALTVTFPKTSNIAEREGFFRELALSFQAPSDNVIAFFGGYAGVMPYPDDWEQWNWNFADSPQLRSEEGSINIWFYPQDFILSSVENFEELAYEDRAKVIMRFPTLSRDLDEGLIETQEIEGVRIFIYDTRQAVFSVDESQWFSFNYTLEDDSIIFEMIEAIVTSYHFSDLSD